MGLLDNQAKEEAEIRANATSVEKIGGTTTVEQGPIVEAGLRLDRDDLCPECEQPMNKVMGAGLPMMACLTCRIALPGYVPEAE